MPDLKVISSMEPRGDQPQAIDKLTEKLRRGDRYSVLLGVTGSGKTFTMANVIARLQRPTLVISHNKTLAAQLYEEFKELFPENRVEYFVSYYDYYQPEAYIAARDIYIEKDSSKNEDLDRLRLSATASLSSRRDVIIVASVSCIYGLGRPEDYKKMVVPLRAGEAFERDELLRRLIDVQYERNDVNFKRGSFRVRGDTVEIYPAYEQFGYRVEMFGDQIDAIFLIHPASGETLSKAEQVFIFPAVHYVAPGDTIERAAGTVKQELEMRLIELRNAGKLLEAQRLAARTRYDIEMMLECGYCPGIENYARHLDGRAPGERPYTLIDYFGDEFLLIIDESHVTIPQLKAMYNGDRSRKEVLVEYGFRLPSALDNRPLRFDEFEKMWKQVVFVSATPAPLELGLAGGEVVEQVIRPTGLVDPAIEVRPASGQVADLLARIGQRAGAGERTLITTLTKRLAEDLSEYIRQEGYRCKYLHSEIETLERVEILKDLRTGAFDVLVGVNLLREGLDLPEVSLVAILDADKQGFLRSETSLVQTIGRCARNVNAQVILYADKITEAMRRAMAETNRRRGLQTEYNRQHGITPTTIVKAIRTSLADALSAHRIAREAISASEEEYETTEVIAELEAEMLAAAEALEFERAAELRDRIALLKRKASSTGVSPVSGTTAVPAVSRVAGVSPASSSPSSSSSSSPQDSAAAEPSPDGALTDTPPDDAELLRRQRAARIGAASSRVDDDSLIHGHATPVGKPVKRVRGRSPRIPRDKRV